MELFFFVYAKFCTGIHLYIICLPFHWQSVGVLKPFVWHVLFCICNLLRPIHVEISDVTSGSSWLMRLNVDWISHRFNSKVYLSFEHNGWVLGFDFVRTCCCDIEPMLCSHKTAPSCGNVINNPTEIANNFNDYFVNIGPNLAHNIPSIFVYWLP